MKKNILLPLSLLLIVIIIGARIINYQRSHVSYVDIDCPFCGSSEVLDLGTSADGDQHARCFSCKADFTFTQVTYDDPICR